MPSAAGARRSRCAAQVGQDRAYPAVVVAGRVQVQLGAMPAALRSIGSSARIDLPLPLLGAIAGTCAVLILGTSLVAGALALRRRPLDILAIPE
jgi:hypothetical protein